MVFEVVLRDEKPLAQISVPTSRAGHLHERGRSRLHEPHSLLAIVPDFRDNRHHECRYSRQKGSGKGDLAVCDSHIRMGTSHCGRDYQSHDSQEQAYRERKQRQEERHQQHPQRHHEPSNW